MTQANALIGHFGKSWIIIDAVQVSSLQTVDFSDYIDKRCMPQPVVSPSPSKRPAIQPRLM